MYIKRALLGGSDMESGLESYCTSWDPTCKFPDRSVMETVVVALRRTSLCLSIPPLRHIHTKIQRAAHPPDTKYTHDYTQHIYVDTQMRNIGETRNRLTRKGDQQ